MLQLMSSGLLVMTDKMTACVENIPFSGNSSVDEVGKRYREVTITASHAMVVKVCQPCTQFLSASLYVSKRGA